MPLATLRPAPDFEPAAHADAVEALAALGADDRLLVWCDDGCPDCQALLPDFGAAIEAAGAGELVTAYPVERLPEGEKRGPQVEAYGVERIPTVVVERDGIEVARYVEGDGGPIADSLATQLGRADVAD
ncbi:MAG: thioredoxin [Halobacteriales archaeon]